MPTDSHAGAHMPTYEIRPGAARPSVNVLEALAAEIRRVATLRERWHHTQGDLDAYELARGKTLTASFAPVLGALDAALDRAVAAAGTGDASICISALLELQAFLPAERG